MRYFFALWLLSESLAFGEELRCPTVVLDARASAIDVAGGADVTVTGADPARVAEIRRRAKALADAVHSGAAARMDLGGCTSYAANARVTVKEIPSGVRLAWRADGAADAHHLQVEIKRRLDEFNREFAKPHATLLVDSKQPGAEVIIDTIDSGYQTPTDAIYLPGGAHKITVRDAAGHEAPVNVLSVPNGEVRRVYFQ